MNFVKEINAFKDWLLLNEMPPNAITLWYTLMTIKHMFGWKSRFSAPNPIVQQLSGLSKNGLVQARMKLIENGLIHYQKGKKGNPPVYEMISLIHFSD